jgi:predicted RNase H-like nuclease (RuvC/YqgF family)
MDYSSMYGAKKKRAVDPNAPPRPTLLGHEKVIKDAKSTIEQQGYQIAHLLNRVEELEKKLQNQSSYLSALHNSLSSKRR